jgi:uncharacterized protein (TIGR03067 family)
VRVLQARRRRRETALPDLPGGHSSDVDLFDWKPLLDRELARLPERYRAAILLCDLQGLSRHDAARQLGLAEGTLSSRLARGRERLRQRLVRAGVTLSSGALAAALTAGRADAVPVALRAAVMQMATVAGAGGVSPAVAALGNGVVQAMGFKKMKLTAAIVLCLAVLGGGFGLGGRSHGPVPVAVAAPDEKPRPPAKPAEKRYTFEMRDKRWVDVFEMISDLTKIPLVGSGWPNGTFTFVPPRNPDGSAQTYSIPEIIEIVNEALGAQHSQLVRRKNGFMVIPLDPDRTKTADGGAPSDDLKLLQGTWKVLSGVYNTDDPNADVPARVRIDEKQFILTFRKSSGEETTTMPMAMRLDGGRPRQIHICALRNLAGNMRWGIYSIQGDTLLLALQGHEGKPRPTDFTENLNNGQSLLILRRDKAVASLPAAQTGDARRLQGAWELIAVEAGSATSTDFDRPKVRLHFRGDRFNAATTGRDPDPPYTFHLDETHDPKQIDLVAMPDGSQNGIKGRGIYSLTGDALMLCFTFNDSTPRPTDFTAAPDSNRILHILRREPSSSAVRPNAKPAQRPDAGTIERIDTLSRQIADMQAEIARLREELRKSPGKTP